MNWLGQGIAFSALVAAAAVLYLNGKPSQGLWILVVICIFGTDWYPKQKDSNDKDN